MNVRGLVLLVALLLIGLGGRAVWNVTRGLRNNNPGNIRHSGSKWQGMSSSQTDPDFVQFNTPADGIRALAVLLKNYQVKHGLRSVREIISRYAPPNENKTSAYVEHVAKQLGVGPDARLELSVPATLERLVAAVIKHENGLQPYDLATIGAGVERALA